MMRIPHIPASVTLLLAVVLLAAPLIADFFIADPLPLPLPHIEAANHTQAMP